MYASVTNGRKNGTVNKNNSKTKKLTQRDEPPLTIYPFSINELKKRQLKAESTNKPDKIVSKPIETPSVPIANVVEKKTQIQKSVKVEERKQTDKIVKKTSMFFVSKFSFFFNFN